MPMGMIELYIAYLIYDATFFLSSKEIFAQWRFIDSITKAWYKDQDIPLYVYEVGNKGPKEIKKIIEEDI